MCGGESVAIDLGGSLFSNFIQLEMSDFFFFCMSLVCDVKCPKIKL